MVRGITGDRPAMGFCYRNSKFHIIILDKKIRWKWDCNAAHKVYQGLEIFGTSKEFSPSVKENQQRQNDEW